MRRGGLRATEQDVLAIFRAAKPRRPKPKDDGARLQVGLHPLEGRLDEQDGRVRHAVMPGGTETLLLDGGDQAP